MIGHFSRPSTEPTGVRRVESVAPPQPPRAAAEDPEPIALTAPTAKAPQRAVPAVESGSLLIRSMPAAPPALREIATSAPEHVAAASTNSTGSLQVTSRPSGAQVFIDDNLIGTTPVLLSEVAAGSRLLRVELSGYRIWTTSVQIKPGARFRVLASLEP